MTSLIKICGMRDPDNIRAVAELKPDIMGFIFYRGSKRFAGELLKPEHLSGLPLNIRKAGVFVNASNDEILKIAEKFSLDLVQLHGDESPGQCAELMDKKLNVIKALNIAAKADLQVCVDFACCTNYLLLDTKSDKYGGSGKKFDWSLLDYYPVSHPFLLSGGIGPDDADSISRMTKAGFAGVDLNSRFETEPGLKDPQKLRKFVETIRKE
jgi:phosphoribosylanthranilate isomerase